MGGAICTRRCRSLQHRQPHLPPRCRGVGPVEQVHPRENLLTVRRSNGEAVTYDPRRLQGVTVYRDAERAFARGDRVQVTAPDRQRRVANRELGTIEHLASGRLHLRFDAGRTAAFSLDSAVHLDYGYAVTSHSSQGQTADRVLVHVDTAQGEALVNCRFAYVAVSRGRYDAQLYADETVPRHARSPRQRLDMIATGLVCRCSAHRQ